MGMSRTDGGMEVTAYIMMGTAGSLDFHATQRSPTFPSNEGMNTSLVGSGLHGTNGLWNGRV